MKIKGWRYYNHAAIPSTAPHVEPDLTPIQKGSIWKIDGGKPLFACWSSDWDCKYDTGWWYVIKDTPYEIASLKSNDRYKINKARKYFEFKEICPQEYKESLLGVQVAAFSAYPRKYRPIVDRITFFHSVDKWKILIDEGKLKVFGSFFKETGELCGYIYAPVNESYIDLSVQKTKPNFEKYQVNASLVDGLLTYYSNFLGKGLYICDGSRSISHETKFQDYLEKYFGFRKCYCKLRIQYAPFVGALIRVFFPVRIFFSILGKKCGFAHMIASVLRMEEIARKCR